VRADTALRDLALKQMFRVADMRICVTGVHGQVAAALAALGPAHGVEVLRLGRPDFDLAHPPGVGTLLARLAPDVVVNAAAYTAVDQAERESALAMAVNGTGPGILAEACAGLGLPILQLSTDFVFDGAKATPYREDDPTGPLGVYGLTKRAGEIAVAAANPRHVILRTAWVHAAEGQNFVCTMLRLANTHAMIPVVADQIGCPTYAADLAEAVLGIARQIRHAPAGDPRFGVFHVAGGGETSRAEFAAAIFASAARAGRPVAEVRPVATADYPTPAARPANSRLDCSRLNAIYGLALPHWRDGLARCLEALFSKQAP
jgi:dTDP-4-dehydrorhamnose reductase